MGKKQVKTSEKEVLRNEKGQIIQGTANPNGRPKGVKNFSTVFEAAVKKIAEANPDEDIDVEVDLVLKGIAEAKKGKYQFHKDITDRLYGKPQEKVDITSQGEQVTAINYIIPDGNKE